MMIIDQSRFFSLYSNHLLTFQFEFILMSYLTNSNIRTFSNKEIGDIKPPPPQLIICPYYYNMHKRSRKCGFCQKEFFCTRQQRWYSRGKDIGIVCQCLQKCIRAEEKWFQGWLETYKNTLFHHFFASLSRMLFTVNFRRVFIGRPTTHGYLSDLVKLSVATELSLKPIIWVSQSDGSPKCSFPNNPIIRWN